MSATDIDTRSSIFRHNSPDCAFEYAPELGAFSAETSWESRVSGAEAAAEIVSRGSKTLLRSSEAAEIKYEAVKSGTDTILTVKNRFNENFLVTQEFKFSSERNSFYVRAGLTNPVSGAPVEVVSLNPLSIGGGGGLRLGHSPKSWSVYNLGFQSWTPAEAVPACGRQSRPNFKIPQVVAHNPLRYPPREKGRHLCDWLAAIKSLDTSDSLLCGFVTMKDMLSHIYLEVDPKREKFVRLNAHCGGDKVELKPAQSMNSEWLFVLLTRDPLRGMDEYADAVKREMKARIPSETPVGWCSWYKYFTDITQKDMLVNLEALSELSKDIPIKFFQIDDGYQKAVGDWLTLRNDRFPSGMERLSSAARKRGFEPGIWVAPFFARKNSKLFLDHKDWFLRDKKGAIAFGGYNPGWGGALASLDLTRPDVLDWLRETFSVIVNDWGYKYLKLDFLYSAVVDGERRDKSVTRAQAYRRGMEVIREAAGDDAFILGCGAPLGPSAGIVDAMRIGTDVGPVWRESLLRAFLGSRTDPGVETSLLNCVTRSFLHGKLWANDPDCILLRKGKLTSEEYKTFATVIGLTGAMVLISDDMRELDEEGMRVFSTLIPPTGTPAIPADLFESVRPSVYSLAPPGRENTRTVAAINWNDSEGKTEINFAVLGLDPDAYYNIFSFWDERYLGTISGEISFRGMPPHGCKLLAITPSSGAPSVVGSNLHITCGAFDIKESVFDAETNSLCLSVELPGKRDGKIFIYAPAGFNAIYIEGVSGGSAVIGAAEKHIQQINVRFRDAIHFTVRFEKDGI